MLVSRRMDFSSSWPHKIDLYTPSLGENHTQILLLPNIVLL